MTDVDVRDKNNFIIGRCTDYGNSINATSFKKGYVGVYYKNTNMTFNAKGDLYCYGDGTQSLIRDAER